MLPSQEALLKQPVRTGFILYYVMDVENKQEVHAIVADLGQYRCMLRNSPPQRRVYLILEAVETEESLHGLETFGKAP